MKRLAVASTICLSFLLTATLSALAQDERREEEHKEVRQEERHDERHDEHVEKRDEHVAQRRIADEHFRSRFGRDHHFAVRHVTVVGGERRFAYGGYNFAFGQPWPSGWRYTDDCYIDFVDGAYYLFNVRHPGVRIAVNVVP
jgi:Ni/Co efflux regulator RcnB